MTAAPATDDLDDLVARVRAQISDVDTARLLLEVIAELRERRQADDPRRVARLRLQRQVREAHAAGGVTIASLAERFGRSERQIQRLLHEGGDVSVSPLPR